MDRIKLWLRRCLPTRRRLIQLYAALLYNAHLTGFATGTIYTGASKALCVPGLNCYSCPGAVGACPLGALQNALASAPTRAPYYVLGTLLLFGLTLGRVVCGFLCPFGLIQELLHKLPTPKIKKGRVTRALSSLKYALLAVFVIYLPLYWAAQRLPVPAFCKYICPAGTLEGAVALLSHPANADKYPMLGLLFTRKFLILLAASTLAVFLYRPFCRFICPLGAIYGFFARVSLLGVEVDGGKCTRCGQCHATCPVDIRHVGDRECIQCGACQAACPTQAIRWKGLGAHDLPPQRKLRKAAACACALAVLVGALVYFNPPVQAQNASPAVTDDMPVGSEVGMRCADFTVETARGALFRLAEHRGQVVVINFWATWCGPCVKELPYFQQLWENYPHDQVQVIALHASLLTEDWRAYLESYDYTLPFALDGDGAILSGLGGSMMLPQTVVLDQQGVIVYNQVGSVTYPLLQSLVDPLLADAAGQ